jgi:cell division protease FtsH
MVTQWGLSEKLGPLTFGEEEGEVFLGRSVTQHKSLSDETAHIIDEEIRSIVDRNYSRAENILKENIDILHAMCDALIKYETIDKDQIADLMAGKTPKSPEGWDDSSTSGDDKNTTESIKEDKPSSDSKIGGPAGEH